MCELSHLILSFVSWFFFFFNDTATTEIYTLSLHDALPTSPRWNGLLRSIWTSPTTICSPSAPVVGVPWAAANPPDAIRVRARKGTSIAPMRALNFILYASLRERIVRQPTFLDRL